MTILIYHNPRCSKSRQTLKLLQERGIEPTVVEYLETPPSVTELKRILHLLGMTPRELVRTKEAVYAAAGLDDRSVDDDALLQAMVANPILIERPIVVAGNRAAIGRPPENVLSILD